MSEAFKVGDVVRLKSGGPRMTVTNAGDDMSGRPFVECAWFEGTTALNGAFPPLALLIPQPASSGGAPAGSWKTA